MKEKQIYGFGKEQRSSFGYWFVHLCASQMVALNLHIWKPKYLFHDIEKPWLRLFLPYEKVQYLHDIAIDIILSGWKRKDIQ